LATNNEPVNIFLLLIDSGSKTELAKYFPSVFGVDVLAALVEFIDGLWLTSYLQNVVGASGMVFQKMRHIINIAIDNDPTVVLSGVLGDLLVAVSCHNMSHGFKRRSEPVVGAVLD
jgi:hypothetical protein